MVRNLSKCKLFQRQLFDPDITLDLKGPERVTRLAQLFRTKMNENMQFGAHGNYRQSFYDAVSKKAKKVSVHGYGNRHSLTCRPVSKGHA